MFQKTPRRIYDELVEKAMLECFRDGGRRREAEHKRPGKLIEKLSQEDRDTLRGLTSDDIINDRVLVS